MRVVANIDVLESSSCPLPINLTLVVSSSPTPPSLPTLTRMPTGVHLKSAPTSSLSTYHIIRIEDVHFIYTWGKEGMGYVSSASMKNSDPLPRYCYVIEKPVGGILIHACIHTYIHMYIYSYMHM